MRELVPKLVYEAQNSPDETIRNAIVESLLIFYECNDPLNQDLWSDLNNYQRILLNGDDAQKTEGRRIGRIMLNIHREAQKLQEAEAS